MDFLTDPFLVSKDRFDGPVLVTGAGGCIGAWVVSILTPCARCGSDCSRAIQAESLGSASGDDSPRLGAVTVFADPIEERRRVVCGVDLLSLVGFSGFDRGDLLHFDGIDRFFEQLGLGEDLADFLGGNCFEGLDFRDRLGDLLFSDLFSHLGFDNRLGDLDVGSGFGSFELGHEPKAPTTEDVIELQLAWEGPNDDPDADRDCESGVCTGGVCAEPSCADDVTNGDETDRDCGGACAGCWDGAHCEGGADCESGVCRLSRCAGASCGDGVWNGHETGSDCGCMPKIRNISCDAVSRSLRRSCVQLPRCAMRCACVRICSTGCTQSAAICGSSARVSR